jgi:hypothetical protein
LNRLTIKVRDFSARMSHSADLLPKRDPNIDNANSVPIKPLLSASNTLASSCCVKARKEENEFNQTE